MLKTCDLIIPMFNEASCIDALFDALDVVRERGVIRHVVIGDNGSTDDSPAMAQRRGAIVVREPKRGYGAACLAAIAWIRLESEPTPDAIAFIDADLADDPTRLETLIDALTEYDVAIGSRRHFAEPGALNFAQRFGGLLAAFLLLITTGQRYRDIGPMRAIRWDAYERLGMRDPTWGWTVELQAKAPIAGLRIIEIDVPYRRRHSGRSKISGSIPVLLRAGTKIILTILYVRLFWRPARGVSK